MSNLFPAAKNNYVTGASSATLATAGHASAHNEYETAIGITGTTDNTSLRFKTSEITGGDTGVGKTATQTMTNKTLTAPTVTSPTISGTVAGGATYTAPTFTAPVLGVASVTSVNKVAITTPASDATLTLANGSTLATSGAYSQTLTATASTNVTLPTTGTLSTLAGSETLTNKTLSTSTALNSSADQNFTFYGMARQALINSSFVMNARNQSSYTPTDVTVVYGLDHWYDYVSRDGGTLPTLGRTQETLTPGDILGSYNYSRLTTNGAGTSLGTNSYHIYAQKMERGTRNLAGTGKSVTVSFYAKSSIASKKLGVRLVQNYGTGGSPTADETINGETYTLTSSWVKYTHTFTLNTIVGKTFGTSNNDDLGLQFGYMWGATIASTFGDSGAQTYVGSGTIDIDQLQVCSGTVALPYQPLSRQEEIERCGRFCQSIAGSVSDMGQGPAFSTTVAYTTLYLPIPMVSVPTLSSLVTAGDYQLDDTVNTPSDVTGIAIDDLSFSTNKIITIKATVASGLTQYRTYHLVADGSARTFILESEL